MNSVTFKAAAGVVAALICTGSQVHAATLIGTFDGNDPFPAGGSITVGGVTSPGLAKCDTGAEDKRLVVCDKWEDGGAAGDYSGAFKLSYELDDSYAVSWSYAPGDVTGTLSALFPRFVAVKQAGFYKLWELDADEYLGSTIETGLKAISHVSFFDGAGVTPSPVPLPAAGWLLLAGLGGMAALRRRA